MTPQQQQAAAAEFARQWQGRGYEKGESQLFWISLLRDVLGVEKPETFIVFEEQVKLDHTSFIDARIPASKVLIEQKSVGKNLMEPIRQSDGSLMSPFRQAKRYITELPLSAHPRWVVTCNFAEMHVYDMERPGGEPEKILLADLERDYYRLSFLLPDEKVHLKQEMEVSIKAGEIVGELYDALIKEYRDPENPDSLASLNMLCVRLVFCLYAEDAGIFGKKQMFHDFLEQYDPAAMRRMLMELFRVLDTPVDERDPYLDDALAAFPYVNGGLFADENIEIPRFNDEICRLLLTRASDDFDWSQISPTIFGAVFESTLNPVTRRSGGMHYTSIENIHKLIDPLFLDDLRREFRTIADTKVVKTRNARLLEFQKKLAAMRFLDPACGSGNFLTETYICLRRLENECIRLRLGKRDAVLDVYGDEFRILVQIDQFYGIEINDFAVSVARTALWIAESQMMRETMAILQRNLEFLPLKTAAHIVEGNALRTDWESVVPKSELTYIMGNPPFVGARLMSQEQKDDLLHVFGAKWKNAGNLDYVACWYKKAADLMAGTTIRSALVSTNSVAQGESVANLWKPLFGAGVHFDFAHRTFRWDSEANLKAHVHCVIIGFSAAPNNAPKKIFDGGQHKMVNNINGYLIDADNIFVESRNKPICDVPEIGIGNKPIDDGNYLFTEEEKDEFIKKEPQSAPLFKLWYGSQEFINRKPRYCLWLGDCSPAELRKMPECLKRVQAVRDFRLASKSAGTIKLADKPTRFHVENMPKGTYLLIPRVSSEKRKFIPIGFMNANMLSSDSVHIIPSATLYHFGILTSNVHMAWMRAVCGRLEMRYRYSKDIVYNNFPWPAPAGEQKAKIEQTAQAVLDARALYPDSSLADLYDELAMPPELRRAHQSNDRAVMAAYGFSTKMTESECVAQLMEMYLEKTRT